jgi:hypothetical protein
MADTGLKTSGTITDSGSAGTNPPYDKWADPSNASSINASVASFAVADPALSGLVGFPIVRISTTLQFRNFNASVPTGATINGIEVVVTRDNGTSIGGGGQARDYQLQLVIGGTATGTDKADTATYYPSTITGKTYGSSTDLWGLTPTDTQVNATDFGVDFRIQDNAMSGVDSIGGIGLDAIQVKIYYTTGGGGGTTVTAESGTLTLTGGNATITQAVSVPANTGTLALTGGNAVIATGLNVPADTGSLTLAGGNAVILMADSVIAGSGTLALTGSNAVIALEDNIVGDSGSLALTGNSADISEGESITAETGTLALSGNEAIISTDEGILADTGVLTLSGNEAVVILEETVTGETGSLTLTGNEASVTTGESVTLESGSLTLTGSEAVITSSDTVVADTGTLALTGSDAVITENENISLESGTLTLTGNDATITEQTASDVVAESGTLALTGNEAVIITSSSIPAESGSLALTGSNAVIDEGITVVAESGSIGLTGNNALITEAQSVIASTGTLTLNGNNAVINEGVTASSGALTLTGSNAVIEIDASVTVIADSGTLTLTGNQAVIIEGKQVIADTGVLTLVGSNAVINEEVTASSGVLILVGGNAVIISNDNVPASSGSLTLVGSDAFIGTTLPPVDGGIPSFIPFSEILRQRVELIPMRNQILLDNVEMARLRTYTGVWKKLQNICDYQMNDEPQAVVRFDPDAVYSTVTGVNPVKDRFYLDADKAYRHGLCYQITGETKYAVKAQQIIDDWAFKLREINGSVPQGYINFRIAHYIMAGAWVRNVEGWDGNLFETFLLRIEHLSRWERFNNVGAWGILFNICIASYQNDPSKLALWSERLQAQILEQVSSNGVMTGEVTRNGGTGKQGIAYSNFGMLPWAMAGEVLAKEGYTIFGTPAGDRLGLAYYQLMEWILNPRQFPYYTGDVTLMDSPWQVTYVYIMQKYYSNDNADRVIAMKEHQVPNSFMLDFLFGFQWNPTSEIEKYG